MKKIALIVQRYGLAVNGGAELHCRILAEQLRSSYDVEVLTSCAKEYTTWANAYPEGPSEVNRIKLKRFAVPYERNPVKSRRLFKKMRLNRIFPFYGNAQVLAEEWSKQQGPYLPGLISYLKAHEKDYDALIFFTYLYYPTFCGLRVAPHKSILIPTAHDESAIHLPAYKEFFKLPAAILYNTLSEKKLVNRLFNNEEIYSDIVGVGMDEVAEKDIPVAAEILGSEDRYLIYIGRIDAGKGCELMLDYFLKYKKLTGHQLKMVLLGKSFMKITEHPDVIYLGFVEEDIKRALLKQAEALIMPSYYESLSLVTLESMQLGVPVIVNARSEVLKDHVENSGAGYAFTSFPGFKFAVDEVLNNEQMLGLMRLKAKKYVNDHYNWKLVLHKIEKAVTAISG
ncbi:glycosyltransferase family 4 protein [Pedobacter heparinus]|uniref:glycosyltransferase family 4 protein n=1 Tax=Pedobacter heparinus TaxID=984 RepID=UPI00292E1E5B|nr:glycosyltransferase family 4 protein [Pedobacter heparinus]